MSIIRLSDQLKEQTQMHHQSLEKQVVTMIKSITTSDDYAELLMHFYTYFGGLELLVEKAVNLDRLPDYSERRKIASLKTDLEVLKVKASSLATSADLPAITTHPEALGAMYVMEGSTLGGVHISKMISQRLPAESENALTFFNGYGSNTQQMWQKFKTIVDSEILKPEEVTTVIAAANETFTRFGDWIRRS